MSAFTPAWCRARPHQLEALIEAGVLGAKAFLVHSGIDDFPAADEATLRAALPMLARHGVPLLAHAEVESVPPPPRGAANSPMPPGWPRVRAPGKTTPSRC
jgi:dihydroorotase-like cyclic amidohydrolase